MLDALAIALREFAEMALIVGSLCIYLRNAGRAHLVRAALWGIGIGAVPAIGVGSFLVSETFDPHLEAILETGVAIGVLLMATGMVASAGSIRGRIADFLDAWLDRRTAALGIVGFVALVVFREILEVVVFVQAIATKAGPSDAVAGLVLGLACAALVVPLWRWMRWRSGLLIAFRASALLLSLFSIELLLHGLSDLLRLHVLPDSGAHLRAAMEPLLEGGPHHGWLTAALMALVLLHAARSWWFQLRSAA